MLVIRLVVLINSKFSLPQDTSYDLSAVVYSILLKGIVLIIKKVYQLIRNTPENTGSLIDKRTWVFVYEY